MYGKKRRGRRRKKRKKEKEAEMTTYYIICEVRTMLAITFETPVQMSMQQKGQTLS